MSNNKIEVGQTTDHKGKEHKVINVHKWNVENSREDKKNYPSTTFTTVTLFNKELGISKINI